jgi:benzoate/toluate 1,2-dioxygenase subunit beta
MSFPVINDGASAIVFHEALLLDEKKWEAWLDLYTEDAVFWLPAWKSELETTSDPENELNLLYLRGRAGLEDRVFRLEAGDSFASVPLDRTVHVVGNAIVIAINESNGELDVAASWLCHVYGIRGSFTRGGRYDYRLRKTERGLKIASKKITMIDDKLEGPVDVYHV